jgi:UTP-glucose-1-phosphate uridylyltransferase
MPLEVVVVDHIKVRLQAVLLVTTADQVVEDHFQATAVLTQQVQVPAVKVMQAVQELHQMCQVVAVVEQVLQEPQ